MNRIRRREAFTLIELLTVMAIITLLIGILTPALTTARDQARKTAVKAQINAMEVGLESFHQDEGKYVPSNAVYYSNDLNNATTIATAMSNWEIGTMASPLQGAHLLLDALVGRDFLGYDSKAPPFGPGGGSGTYDRWKSTNDRRQPYIPPDGIDVTSADQPPTDAFGGNPDLTKTQPTVPSPNSGETTLARVFRDKFGWPILYYRASPSANQNSPIITSQNSNAQHPYYGDGVFDGKDNEFFTSYQMTQGGKVPHKISDADQILNVPGSPTTPYNTPLDNRFAEFIRSIRASTYNNVPPPQTPQILQPRPVKSDRFIILSAGKDGIFGTLDDVANFSVLSEER